MTLPLLYEIPVHLSRDEARREAERELSRSKYDHDLPPWIRELGRIWREQLERLLTFLGGGTTSGLASSGWLVVAVILFVIAVIVALLIWRFGLPHRAARADAEVDTDERLSSADYVDLAERAAAAGDWRRAVQETFRALVRELEVRTLIEHRPSRTALETAVVAAQLFPPLTDPLRDAARRFNEVTYGDRAAGPDDYETLDQLRRHVVAAADTLPPVEEPVP